MDNNKVKVYNVSDNAVRFPWMVIRFVEGDFWYYGSWNKIEDAARCAAEVGGAAVPTHVVLEA